MIKKYLIILALLTIPFFTHATPCEVQEGCSGLTSVTQGNILFGNGQQPFGQLPNLFFDSGNNLFGVSYNGNAPDATGFFDDVDGASGCLTRLGYNPSGQPYSIHTTPGIADCVSYFGDRVGLGVLSPTHKLDLMGNSIYMASFTSPDNDQGYISTCLLSTGGHCVYFGITDTLNAMIQSATGGFLDVQVEGGGPGDASIRHLDLGSTVSHAYPLNVSGQANFTDKLTFSGVAGTAGQMPVSSGGGIPVWTTVATGGGNSKFATTTNGVGIYPSGGTNIGVVIGRTSTTTNSLLEVNGTTTAKNFVATSSTDISTFAGNVGIGTTTPNSTLTVVGSGFTGITVGRRTDASTFSGLLGLDSSSGAIYFQNSGNALSINNSAVIGSSAGTNRINIASNGNVGISSSTPIATFSVKGISGTTPFVVASSTDDQLLVVTQNGNVGIGTTTPNATLNVVGSGFTGIVVGQRTDAATFSGLLGFQSSLGTVYMQNNGNGLSLTNDAITGVNAGTNRFTLASTGNIGVGTTTPWGLLSVNPNGISGPSFIVGSSTATQFVVRNGGNVGIKTSAPNAYLQIGAGTPPNIGTPWDMYITDTSFGRVGINSDVNNTCIELLESGTRTWGTCSVGTAFQLYNNQGSGQAMNIDASNRANFSSVLSVGSDTTPDYRLEVNNTAGSGYLGLTNSADGDIMVVDGTGNVGIGTTTPYAKLSVVGQVVGSNFTATSTTATSTFSGDVVLGRTVRLAGYTVATLTTCNATSRGSVAYVTDALTPTFLTALVGGGAVVTPAFCNGTNWVAQ